MSRSDDNHAVIVTVRRHEIAVNKSETPTSRA
jgi:hypothetical protein